MADLCTISDVQALTQQTYSGSTTPTSTQVSAWITDISAEIEAWTGKKYASTTATAEKHSGNGTVYIMTKYYPILTISSLTVDGTTLIQNTDYWIEDSNGGLIECAAQPIERAEGDSSGHENISITYTYGLSAIPAYVKQFCAYRVALQAVGAATMAGTSSGAVKSYSDGDVSIQYADGDGIVAGLIRRYEELKKLVPRKFEMKVGAP